jgi:ribonuclease Z
MVDIVFLGTGGAFAAGRRGNLALLIEQPDFRMLAEAGPTVIQQLARANLVGTDIQHLFVSHSHGDHSLGFPMLALCWLDTPGPYHVYAGPGTATTLKTLWALAYADVSSDRLDICWHELSEEGPSRVEIVEGMTMRTQKVVHPPGVPTLAARWDLSDGPSFTFVTDTIPCARAIDLARDSDLLIHEASFSATLQPDVDPTSYFHSTARQVGDVARQAGCPRLALVHLGAVAGDHPDVLIAEARADTTLEVIVPEDGDRIHLPFDRASSPAEELR